MPNNKPMRRIRLEGVSKRGRHVVIAHYSEDQANYRAEDHAMRDARLLITVGQWNALEVWDNSNKIARVTR